jgi:hypothetical protein
MAGRDRSLTCHFFIRIDVMLIDECHIYDFVISITYLNLTTENRARVDRKLKALFHEALIIRNFKINVQCHNISEKLIL